VLWEQISEHTSNLQIADCSPSDDEIGFEASPESKVLVYFGTDRSE
jgi:hypothetical protein